MCPNPKCTRHKQITFTPRQQHLEGAGFRFEMVKIFEGTQTAWNNFLKPAVNTLAPVIGRSVGAKGKNPHLGLALQIIYKVYQEETCFI